MAAPGELLFVYGTLRENVAHPVAAVLFAELDRYEDCDPDDPSAGEYLRVRARVESESADPVEAWIYRYNRPTHRLSRIQSGDYCAHHRSRRTKP